MRAVVFAIVALALLISTFFLPWFGIHNINEEYDLDTGELEYRYENGLGFNMFSITGYGGGGMTLYSGGTSISILYFICAMLLIIALIAMLLYMFSIFMKWVKKIENVKMNKMIQTFAILTIVCCLLSPIIFMVGQPAALKADAKTRAEETGGEYEEPDHNDPTKSFFGSYEEKDESSYDRSIDKTTWGGDIGWFMAFITLVFVLISFINIRKTDSVPKGSDYYSDPRSEQPVRDYAPSYSSQPPPQSPPPRTPPPPPPGYSQQPPPPSDPYGQPTYPEYRQPPGPPRY
jgi:hypothetical protein